MEPTRGRENRADQQASVKREKRQKAFDNGAPNGFEGMNFEQQRGAYRENASDAHTTENDRGNNSERRQDQSV